MMCHMLTLLITTVITITTLTHATPSPSSFPTPSYYSSTGSAWSSTWRPSSLPASQPDRGTFWPWSTPAGTLPAAVSSDGVNSIDMPNVVNDIIWQTDSVNVSRNIMTPIASYGGTLRDYGKSSQHSYYHAAFLNYNYANGFWNFISMSNITCIWVAYGSTQRRSIVTSPTLLMLRYSYIWNAYLIPYISSPTATWTSGMYYVTARSRLGEFHMITYTNYTQALAAYSEVLTEYADGTPEKQWNTVKLYGNGYAYSSFTTCRGAELEHLGAFQWLELPQHTYRSYTPGKYYMLVAWRALSGARLERMQVFTDYQSAMDAKAWVSWYSSLYDAFYNQATVVVYYNKVLYASSRYDAVYSKMLSQDYYWVTDASPTYKPYPTQPPIIDAQSTSTSWNDLPYYQRAYIIAYPTAVVAIAVIILIIIGCCLKRGRPRLPTATRTFTSVRPTCHGVTCVVVLLSIASVTMLIISLSMKSFSNVEVKSGDTVIYVWAKYGPFQVFQTTPYLAWLPVLWTARVMSPIAGISMIISICTSIATLLAVPIAFLFARGGRRTSSSSCPLFVSVVAFVSSLLAVLVWIPVQERVLEANNDDEVLRPWTQGPYLAYSVNDRYNPSYSLHSLHRYIGTSYILLCVTTGIQLVNVICIACITRNHNQTSHTLNTAPDSDSNDGLQLVEHTSPYYYRDVPAAPVPAPVPASAPSYIYGVPASAPPPPFTFTHFQPAPQSYVYTAPMYQPPRPEPLHEPLIASAVYPTAVAIPAPDAASAGYPSFPYAVEVPLSGPTTAYQRLL